MAPCHSFIRSIVGNWSMSNLTKKDLIEEFSKLVVLSGGLVQLNKIISKETLL
jgi:hypothetical protein